MKKQESPDYREHEGFDLRRSGSSTDCTGLIPALPASEEELEFSNEMYPFLPRASPNAKNAK